MVQSLRLIQASPPSACTMRAMSLRPRSFPVTEGPASALGTSEACACATAAVVKTIIAKIALRTARIITPVRSYPAKTAPPLTLNTSPETNPAQGVQRKTIGPAISSGSAGRPSGIKSNAFLDVSGLESVPADIPVRTQPGATQLHRMPCGASSLDRLLVSESSAPLLAA